MNAVGASAAETLERRMLLSANLLVNGDFESEPNFAASVTGYGVNGGDPGYSLLTGNQIPGWTIVPGHGVTVHNTSEYPVISGNFSVNTDGEGYNRNNADFYQILNSTLGQTYKLEFDWQGWQDNASVQLNVAVVDTVTDTPLFNGLYSYNSALSHVSQYYTGTGNPVRLEVSEAPQSGFNDNMFIVDNFSVTMGASNLAVTAEPTTTAVNAKMAPVTVELLDPTGTVNPNTVTPVTVVLASTSTGAGKLSGTTTVNTEGGYATFSDLSIDTPGQYSFNFTDNLGDSTASALFEITGGKLVFLKPPRAGNAGEALHPPVVVALENAKGKIIAGDSSSVVTLTPISVKPNPTISGNSVQMVSGKATFSNVILDIPDLYRLQADDGGDGQALSARFKISNDHLLLSKPPASTNVNSPILVTVEKLDPQRHLHTDENTDSVILQLLSGTGAVLDSAEVAFVNGIADFSAESALVFNVPGTYTIRATEVDAAAPDQAVSTTPVTSRPFKILAYHLKVTQQPAAVMVNSPIVIGVAKVDAKGLTDAAENTDSALFQLLSSTHAVIASVEIPFVNGFASVTLASGFTYNIPGTYTIKASDIDTFAVDPSTTTKPITSKAFEIVS